MNHVLPFPCCRDRVAGDSKSRTGHGLYSYVQFSTDHRIVIVWRDIFQIFLQTLIFALPDTDSISEKDPETFPVINFKKLVRIHSLPPCVLSLSRIEISRAFLLSYGNRTSSAMKSQRFRKFTAAFARLRPQLLMACESPTTRCGQIERGDSFCAR